MRIWQSSSNFVAQPELIQRFRRRVPIGKETPLLQIMAFFRGSELAKSRMDSRKTYRARLYIEKHLILGMKTRGLTARCGRRSHCAN